MSLAPSVAVPRASFNPLPLYDRPVLPALEFCLCRRKDRRHLLPAADPAGGAVFAGGSSDPRHLRRFAAKRWSLSLAGYAGVRAARRRQQRALSRPRLYRACKTVSAGLGGLIVSANPVFTAVLAALRPRTSNSPGARSPGCCSASSASASSSGIACRSAPTACTASCSHLPRSPRSWPAPSCSSCWRRRAASGSATASRISPRGLCCSRFAFTLSGRRRHRAEHAVCLGAFAFLTLGGSILAYLFWFHLLQGLRRDRGERLSLPDAAARHAVRLDRAGRARRRSAISWASFRWRSASIW